MRKVGLVFGAVVLAWTAACGSMKSVKPSRVSDLNFLKSSENQRTYEADYDTTFRAAVDALRQIDNNIAKLVKRDAGLIVFKKPDNAGTITAELKKIDERTTRVELVAKNDRRLWLDANDRETAAAFFAQLDRLLAEPPSDESGTAAGEAGRPVNRKAQAPPEESQEGRSPLLVKLRQKLQLEEEASFLDKLSYEDLVILDQKLGAVDSTVEEREGLARNCASCYIDLARVYHDAGQYARSAEALKTAITIEPDNAVAHCNLGEIYKHLRLFDDAVRELEEAKRLAPDLPDTYINLGIIHDDYLIDDQKALEYYNKYLELGGTDKQVLEWISAIERGS
jgi:tetratricopeptide (TPR) repeat protein